MYNLFITKLYVAWHMICAKLSAFFLDFLPDNALRLNKS